MSERVEKIVEDVKGLTLLEAADLVKRLEEVLGVSAAAAAPVAVAGAAGAADAGAWLSSATGCGLGRTRFAAPLLITAACIGSPSSLVAASR